MTTHIRAASEIPAIGIDVGGTKCLGVLRDGDAVVVRVERQTPIGSRDLVETIVDIVTDIESQSDGRGNGRSGGSPSSEPTLGVGLPGLVTRSGVLRAAPNLVDVAEFDAKRILEDRLGRHVWLDNDATCATVAEWIAGTGQGCADMLMVTIGTGIGAGIVANGALVRGANGFAGELGHMFVDPDGPECPCGRKGCWERYASGSGLAFLARRAVEAGSGQDFLLSVGSIDAIRGEDVADLAARGSDEARAVIDEFARWVAVGLASMTNVVDPERIVLGGGAARMGDLLMDPVRSWLRELLYASDHRPVPEVSLARFGESAGAIGAAMLPLVHR